ncbi:MAG: UDP-N-acetylmuramoyl-tripeptide--D-alanyl-D-alanine ligase [Puniceicoccaceae bacterium]
MSVDCRDSPEKAVVFEPSFFEETLGARRAGRDVFEGAGGFSIDTRSLAPGEVFVALRTERRDGHDFLEEAAARGAAGAIVSTPRDDLPLPQMVVDSPLAALQRLGARWRRRWPGRVFGVTGSCGKTSTKELLGLLLGKEDTFVSPGNLNNHIGVPLSLLRIRPEHRRAVIEAGISEHGEMETLASLIRPDVALVTTIGPAHLEKLGSLEGIAAEKARLPRAAREATFFGPACAEYAVFSGGGYAAPRWLQPEAGAGISVAAGGVVWRYRVGGDPRTVHLCDGSGGRPMDFAAPEATAGMLENTCLAVLTALSEGVPPETVRVRLGEWRPASQRGEVLSAGGRRVYADHYNANPASFADAAHYFHRRFPEPPRCWVIGAMEELGADTIAWHRRLADALPVLAGDRVFLVGPPAQVMEPVLRARGGPGVVVVAAETPEAVAPGVAAAPGTLFLKGSRRARLEKILDFLEAAAP